MGLAAIAARVAVLPLLPVPQPTLPDEFSHLLAAETFMQGRLTNPTPAMWTHFETLHVLLKPTYMSMYPPGQALFLAAGLKLTGTAFAGVLLGTGLMCGAMCWMLQGWFSPGWALLGGLLAVMRFGVFNYWANSYWGGAVAAFGGALVLGALPRIWKRERTSDAVWMGLGLTILANSRPYEGLVFSVPVAAAVLVWLARRRGRTMREAIGRVVLPLALVLAIAAGAMGYDFWRITGSPFRMPEQVAWHTYSVAPYLVGGRPRPVPVYHQEAVRDFYLHNQLGFYELSRTLPGLAAIEFVHYADIWMFYFGPALTLPLLLAVAALPYRLRWHTLGRSARFLIAATAVSLAGITAEIYYFPHYSAPMTGLFLALVILAMRQARAWRPHGRATGRFVVRAVPVVCLLLLAVRIGAFPLHIPITPAWPPGPYNSISIPSDWARIEQRLSDLPGKHLVLVHFVPEQKSDALVFNEPRIDQAKVIWAWDMGRAENDKLIRCYGGRRVWMVDPRESPARLEPYSSAAARP